ncbi:MAG: nucleoside deaminase [Oscillospiraceae bacterium]|jgi:tRNA(adenine34) deaminase|nr:nucleoside deaminase [Oscillospiraceae bacterium]
MNTHLHDDGKAAHFMRLAIVQAKTAASLGEVPVGAVIVRDDEIVASAFNRRETDKNALAHAELMAIDMACKKLGGWRLHMCDLYVTLEPCPMCAGAIINARIKHVYYGAYDKKAGCMGTLTDFNAIPFNHHPLVTGGILEDDCKALLSSFFTKLRKGANQ